MLVDDHAVVRQGLRSFLELQPDIEVVGEAAGARDGVQLAARLSPDVVLMDLLMPDEDGVDAIRALRDVAPRVRVLVLTSYLDETHVSNVLQKLGVADRTQAALLAVRQRLVD